VSKIAARIHPFADGFGDVGLQAQPSSPSCTPRSPKTSRARERIRCRESSLQGLSALYNDFFRYIDLVVKNGTPSPGVTISAEIAASGFRQDGHGQRPGSLDEGDTLKDQPQVVIGFDGYPTNENASLTKVIAGADQRLRVYKGSPVLKETLAFVNWWYTSDYGKKVVRQRRRVIPPIKDRSTQLRDHQAGRRARGR